MLSLPGPAKAFAGQILPDKTATQESAARGLKNELRVRVWVWARQIVVAIQTLSLLLATAKTWHGNHGHQSKHALNVCVFV